MPRTSKARMTAIPEDELTEDAKYLAVFDFLELAKEPSGLEVYRAWRKLAKAGKVAKLMIEPDVHSIVPEMVNEDTSPPRALTYPPSVWAGLKKNHATKMVRLTVFLSLSSMEGKPLRLNQPEEIDAVGMNIFNRVTRGEDPYQLGRKLCLSLEGKASSVIHRAVTLFRAWLKINDVPINDELWLARVQPPKAHTEKEQGLLAETGIRQLINDEGSSLEMQLCYHILAETGARISEVLFIKTGDLELEKAPGIPLLLLRKTKTDQPRYAPISQECYGLFKQVTVKKDSNQRVFNELITTTQMYKRCRRQLVKYGLTKKKEWIRGGKEAWTVTLHSFRQFAEDHMLNHGIAQYDPDAAKVLVGRKTAVGSRAAYLRIERLAPIWKEKVEPFTNWIGTPNISAPTLPEKPPLLGVPRAETIAIQPEAGTEAYGPSTIIPVEPASLKPQEPVRLEQDPEDRDYPEPDQDPTILQKPVERFGCSICHALTFATLWEARDHVDAENKGKPQDDQWRHYILKKKPEATPFPLNPYAKSLSEGNLLPRVKEIVDHAATEIVSQLRPKLAEPEPLSMGKCGDCNRYHANPVRMDGTGGPCPSPMNTLSYWNR